jgi:hypothetical protein
VARDRSLAALAVMYGVTNWLDEALLVCLFALWARAGAHSPEAIGAAISTAAATAILPLCPPPTPGTAGRAAAPTCWPPSSPDRPGSPPSPPACPRSPPSASSASGRVLSPIVGAE